MNEVAILKVKVILHIAAVTAITTVIVVFLMVWSETLTWGHASSILIGVIACEIAMAFLGIIIWLESIPSKGCEKTSS